MNRKHSVSVKRNAVLSVIKQIFSILFPMVTFPYATRVLGVEVYGQYTFSASIVNYISYIAAAGILRYAVRECARVRDNRENLGRLVNELFTINLITTVTAYAVLFALFAFVPGLRAYAGPILIISLSVLFTTLGTDWINSAHEEYFYITVRYIISQIAAVLLLFLLVRDSGDLKKYALVSVTAGVFANVLNMFHVRRALGVYPKVVLTKSVMKHVKPILYLFVCAIASFIYINSDVTLLRIFTDDIAVGYYGVSAQFYQMVKQIINAAFIVVIPRISHELAVGEERVMERYKRILSMTILLLVPCAIGLLMIRSNLIALFAGREYSSAQSSLAILSVALIPAMLANFLINIVMIPMQQEKQVTVATVISALLNVVLNIVLIPRYRENAAAFTTLLAECIMVAIAWIYCRKIHFGHVAKPIITALLGGAGVFAVCSEVNRLLTKPFWNVFVCVAVSAVVYAAVVFIAYRNKVCNMIREILKRT
ncbi:MAG: flippase [Clostridia bacterium]|nr:flippase [Clostridia bacterium]